MPLETQGYTRGGADELLYYVHHRAPGEARAAVLLVGPMALERTHSYLVWVRWARELARRGFDVLRFDFRGVGESTGDFSAMTMRSFAEDVDRALDLLGELDPGAPIFLHGLRGGALFASRAFASGRGAGMLLWEPPATGRAMLLDTLRHKITSDYAENPAAQRKTRDDYIAELEAGRLVEVEGYPWSRALFESSADVPLVIPPATEARPFLIVHLDGRPPERLLSPEHGASMRVPRPPFWAESKWLRPDLTELFSKSAEWLERACAK